MAAHELRNDLKRWASTLWSISLTGIRINFIAGLALWLIGVLVVVLYYYAPAPRAFFEAIMETKSRYGYLYSGVATAFFGGVIPFFCLRWNKQIPKGRAVSWFLFFVIYWAIRGIEVDAFYRLQAWIFGEKTGWTTIAAKVAIDQFLYCPLWAAPVTAVCYGWKKVGFSFRRMREVWSANLFLFEVPGVLLSTWIVWIPATAIIYSLPLPLQIPLFNLVLCFFVLIISVLAKD